MTENEKLIKSYADAIDCLKKNKPTSGYYMLQESVDMAVNALEEIEQYRAIGTVEECRAAVEQEAKKVIEKYKAKAPEDIEAYGEDAVFGYCPVCGGLQNTVWNAKYCGDCGQKLEWSDED